jgi:hypothetical protein
MHIQDLCLWITYRVVWRGFNTLYLRGRQSLLQPELEQHGR